MPLKVLLLSPPIFDFYYSFHRSEPLGLLYIKEALTGYEWLELDYYDARSSGRSKAIQTPDIFKYLNHIYVKDTSWFSLFNQYKRFGNSFDAIIAYIKNKEHDVVCISSLFSAYHDDVERLIKRIKEETGALVIVGGWAAWADEKVAQCGNADCYVKGDGEIVLPSLLKEIHCSGKKNVRIPKVIESEHSQQNEFFIQHYPRRSFWYTYYGKRIANVICSKGCVYRCDFCSIHPRYRYYRRNFASIEKEFEYLYRSGVRVVNFEDDNFLFQKEFASELLSLMKYYHKKGMSFLCMNGVSASNLCAVLEDAVDAGFLEFNLSLVSSHDALVARYNRPVVKEMITTIAKRCVGRVKVIVFLIAGLPQQSIEECIDDILFLAKMPVIVGFSPLYMLPGVPMFEAMGLPDDRRLCRGSALYSFGSVTREDIAALWKLCRFINRLKLAGDTNDDEMRQHCQYYKMACRDHVWYYRDRDGNWHEGFAFTAKLPDSFAVCDMQGHEKSI